ncbi:hypothetical protein Rsub_09074 [Raphidocelis subcapitata]|uniref:Uncharacterized protein n=1 Tax=Raphidocelis subcapitata TaxID=307507 RepID=A0A2V0P9N1_9CHLO|nr:hypothetical protein Rsub_09074 [Raphidocelis subcapitata]|eukprot:GBF96279.1 hypothetical protein Rsub_09074 [Raphidocelis subcapitata]
MQCGLRSSSAAARAAAAPRPARAPRRLVRVSASADKPSNVAEAEEWVARWRAKQGAAAAPRWRAEQGAAAAAAAPAAAAAGKAGGKLSPCKSFSDGTIMFTAESLKKVSFDDVKL